MKTSRKSALTAGFALVVMAAVAAFTYGYAHNVLVIPNNPEETFNLLNSSRILFRTEILGWFLILILDVVVTWALYSFFKNENKKLSIFTAGLRIIFVIIFAVAFYNFISILEILYQNPALVPQLASRQIMNHLNSFESTWSFALIIFGFHLISLGVLSFKSQSIHNVWGILLVFAGASYSLIHGTKVLFPAFENQIKTAEMILSLPMAFGEIGFAFWLIFRGGKHKIKYKVALE